MQAVTIYLLLLAQSGMRHGKITSQTIARIYSEHKFGNKFVNAVARSPSSDMEVNIFNSPKRNLIAREFPFARVIWKISVFTSLPEGSEHRYSNLFFFLFGYSLI